MQEAQKYLPGDPQLAQIAEGLTHVVSVRSSPPGASVEIKDYLSPGDPWFPLGTTPLDNVRIPTGYLRWRVSKPGVGEYVGAPDDRGHARVSFREFNFPLDAAAKAPEGMARRAGRQILQLWSGRSEISDLMIFPLFYIDRFEVTNRQYQEFVDQGGYQKREYWKEKFIRDGKELSWEQAMDLFRDSTGRPGPSTWAAGHYPAGQADYPVGGVSWYEASAYAEFAGKSLPVIAQWFLAAPSAVAKYIMPLSNFSASAGARGQVPGRGTAGAPTIWPAMWRSGAGTNPAAARGIFWAEDGTRRRNEYFEPGGLPPFHRGANAGFRCVRNTRRLARRRPWPNGGRRFGTLRKRSRRTDAVYRIYKAMYSYDRTPLNAKLESVAQDSTDWRKEKVTFDAAYGKERMAAYLFLPAHVRPPYQTVVFFPSARVAGYPRQRDAGRHEIHRLRDSERARGFVSGL